MKIKLNLQRKLSLLFLLNIIIILLFVSFFTKFAVDYQFRQFCEMSHDEMPRCLYGQIGQQFLESINLSLLLVSFLGFGLALVVSYLFSRSFLKPLRSIIKSAQKASSGNYETRIKTKTNDETDLLIEALNEMYQNLQEIETLRKELVANLSHELSTPLTNIYGYLSALSDKVIDSDQEREQAIEQIKEETERLIALIKELKKLAVVDSQSINLDLKPTNVNQLIKNTVSAFETQLDEKKIVIKYRLAKDLPSVSIDQQKIKQVLINLIDNAIKFSPKKSELELSTAVDGSAVVIGVADRGIGISEKDLPFIFERFFQADRSRSQKDGIGIGLAIAQKIIQAHRGKIEVDSKLGKGTVFRVILPVN